MATAAKPFVTLEEYLERELTAEYKSEYWRGEVFAMSGASAPHNRILGNAFASLHSQLRGSKCRVYGSDMRVHIEATGLETYPDISIVCGPDEYFRGQPYAITNPIVLIEVLSPSTEAYDRGRKAEHYRTLPSLQQYLLVSQDQIHIDVYTRQPEGHWLFSEAKDRTESVPILAGQATLRVGEVYEQVEMADSETKQPPAAS